MPTITERYEAVVSSIDDPQNRGRFKVKCVGLLGDADTELPNFVELVPDHGWFTVPEVGEQVEIEVVVASDRDESWGQASIEALSPVWRGKRFVTDVELDKPPFPIPGVPDDGSVATPPHDDLVSTNYGLRRGYATPHGHLLMFDDKDPRITLTWVKDRLDPGEAPDPAKLTRLEFEPDGSLKVSMLNKHTLHLLAGGKLELKLDNGAALVVEGKDGAAKLTLGDKTDFSVAVAEPFNAMWDAFKTIFDGHIHPTGMGPSGIPLGVVAPPFDAKIISSQMKLPGTP